MSILKKLKEHFFEDHKETKMESMEQKEENCIIEEITEEEENTISEDEIVFDDEADFKEMVEYLGDADFDHVWTFNAGNSTKDFRGNPKFMYIYINQYRPDIKAYWICNEPATIDQIRKLGFHAVLSGTPAASFAAEKTGVAVTEQVRGYVPFRNAKYLNLWHGNGFKVVERKRMDDSDDLRLELAQKYITSNEVYQNQMLLAVTSENQEELLSEFIGIPKEHMIQVGYARCTYQSKYAPIETFPQNFIALKGLPSDTKIAVYAPTFRANRGNSFDEAITDLEKLSQSCEKNHILMIFKMHPMMEEEEGFLRAKEVYGNHPYLLFWDNVNDIYEIMHKIDLLIYDYSSIFSDFLLGGVKHYIRYLYDRDNMIETGSVISEEEYYLNSAGHICEDFESLLEDLEHYEEYDDSEKLEEIKNRQWSYAGEDDFEKTIQAVMDFKIKRVKYPNLYSFDIFDTLLSRKGLEPVSIFYRLRDRMRENGTFPFRFQERFPELRQNAEKNAREYMRKSQDQRESFHVEVKLSQIYDRMKDVYALTQEQISLLMSWEQEEEIASVIPLTKQVDLVKKYVEEGETVVLISDMYLPKETILKMLEKADPLLPTLPLFLSSEYGVMKTSRLLFFEVYRSFKPYYDFGKWIHYGDNINADQTNPRKLGINTRHIDKIEYSEIEMDMATDIGCYDGFLVSAMQARLRNEVKFAKSEFVIDYVAPAFTTYVDWALRDALSKGYETLYFVSRDGHPLKKIADELIKVNHWPLKTKYIYASRRLWRIPSFIDDIDVDFWSDQGGNFNMITSKEKLLHALDIEDDETFKRIFPQLNVDHIDFEDWSDGQPAKKLIPIMKNSEVYREYLLKKAEEERVLVCKYLEQEIDPSEKFAFVEFWGRGFNQLCHSRLWNHVIGREVPTVYYYARTVHGTEGNCIRYNMTTNATELFFIEAIFANMPYRSVQNYIVKDGKVEPEIIDINYDRELFDAMEYLLPEYAKRYAELELDNPVQVDRDIFDFCLNYYFNNRTNPFIYNNIGALVDSVAMYGDKNEFARAYTMEDLENFKNGIPRSKHTMSMTISYMRSSEEFKKEYNELYQRDIGDDPVGGKLLTPNRLEESALYREKYEQSNLRRKAAHDFYKNACSHSIEDKILVLSARKKFTGDALYSLRKQLAAQETFAVKYMSTAVAATKDEMLMREVATARYIITDDNPVQLSGLNLRKGTECIRLMGSAFVMYRKGKARTESLIWRRKYDALMYDMKYSYIQAPSNPIQKQELVDSYDLADICVQEIEGCSITDVYFDKDYSNKILEKLEKKYPEVQGKKIIYYLPSGRARENNPQWLELLDLKRLQQLLGEEYFVFVDIRNKKELLETCKNTINIPGFSRMISAKGFNLRATLCVADVIIGDYRDTFFEAALLSKPCFSTACDYETQMKKKNMIYDLEVINPFPIVRTADELAERLYVLDQYDYEKVEKFREEYLGGCDGHSSERLVQKLIADKNKYHTPSL